MKSLEIIEVRSSRSSGPSLETQLKGLINRMNGEVNCRTIRMYKLFALGTDYSIHLVHDTEEFNPSGSLLGQRLAIALREFGLVNHSIWIEMGSEEWTKEEKNS